MTELGSGLTNRSVFGSRKSMRIFRSKLKRTTKNLIYSKQIHFDNRFGHRLYSDWTDPDPWKKNWWSKSWSTTPFFNHLNCIHVYSTNWAGHTRQLLRQYRKMYKANRLHALLLNIVSIVHYFDYEGRTLFVFSCVTEAWIRCRFVALSLVYSVFYTGSWLSQIKKRGIWGQLVAFGISMSNLF